LLSHRAEFSSHLVEYSKEITTQLLSEIANAGTFVPNEDITNLSIASVLKPQKLSFVNEKQTVAEAIKILTENKASFVIVLNDNGKAMRTIDVLDIVAHCNRKIAKEASRDNLFEIVNLLESLKYQLTKATLLETIPQYNWYGRITSSKKSINHLMHVMSKFPTMKRIPITQNGEVLGVATRDDILSFLLENDDRFEEKMNHLLEDMNLRSCETCIEATFEEKLGYAFKVMWDKQVNGELASCNGSSPLDLFFNWLHFVHSASSLLSYEPAHVDKNTKVRNAVEQMLRENLDRLFVMDIKNTKKTIGLLTFTDLMSFFSVNGKTSSNH